MESVFKRKSVDEVYRAAIDPAARRATVAASPLGVVQERSWADPDLEKALRAPSRHIRRRRSMGTEDDVDEKDAAIAALEAKLKAAEERAERAEATAKGQPAMTLEIAEDALRAAIAALSAADAAGWDLGRFEAPLEKLSSTFERHPERARREAEALARWVESEVEKGRLALRVTRSFVPPDVAEMSEAQIVAALGGNEALGRRLAHNRALRLVRMHKNDIAKLHPKDLEGKYVTHGLDIVELRAVWMSARDAPFERTDADGKKRMWLAALQRSLKELSQREAHHTLGHRDARHDAYAGRSHGPFDGAPPLELAPPTRSTAFEPTPQPSGKKHTRHRNGSLPPPPVDGLAAVNDRPSSRGSQRTTKTTLKQVPPAHPKPRHLSPKRDAARVVHHTSAQVEPPPQAADPPPAPAPRPSARATRQANPDDQPTPVSTTTLGRPDNASKILVSRVVDLDKLPAPRPVSARRQTDNSPAAPEKHQIDQAPAQVNWPPRKVGTTRQDEPHAEDEQPPAQANARPQAVAKQRNFGKRQDKSRTLSMPAAKLAANPDKWWYEKVREGNSSRAVDRAQQAAKAMRAARKRQTIGACRRNDLSAYLQQNDLAKWDRPLAGLLYATTDDLLAISDADVDDIATSNKLNKIDALRFKHLLTRLREENAAR